MLESFAIFLINILGYAFIIYIPVFFIIIIGMRLIIIRRIDLFSITSIFILLPAATPILTLLNGYDNFTAMNYHLQEDDLIVSAITIICLLFISFSIGVNIPFKKERIPKLELAFYLNNYSFIFLSLFSLILVFLFLENGFILNSPYAEFKFENAQYSSLVNQIFNLSIALMLCSVYTDRRRKWIYTFIFISILIMILFSKRNVMVGLSILLIYLFNGGKINFRIFLFSIFSLGILLFVGKVRDVGLFGYFSGEIIPSEVVEYYSMPGGGANIFLSTIGVIDLNNSGELKGFDNFPIISWFSGVTESKIYERSGYQYNGGMHIAAVLYWNFGLFGIFIFGAIYGYIIRKIENILSNMDKNYSGGFKTSAAVLIVMLLSNTIWYGPIGLIKALVVAYFVFILLKLKFKYGYIFYSS